MNYAETGLLQRVAGKYGVDRETVRSGIREAVRAAQSDQSDAARAFWQSMPEDATELDVVLQITKLLYAS